MAASGIFDRHDRRQPLASFETAIAEADLSHDHQRPERSLSQVICGRNSRVACEHQPALSVFDNPPLKRDCFGVFQW